MRRDGEKWCSIAGGHDAVLTLDKIHVLFYVTSTFIKR